MKPKLFIIGSSHANRIFAACEKNSEITKKFELKNLSIPGATFDKIRKNFEKIELTSPEDVVIIQCFGNDLLKKHIKIERFPKKIIHLTKFEPVDLKLIEQVFLELQEIVNKLECNFLVVDIPFRHLHCCVHHRFSGLIAFFSNANKLLKKIFKEKVIDHRRLLGVSRNRIKMAKFYQDTLCDTVHFYPKYYAKMAETLISIVEVGIRPQA